MTSSGPGTRAGECRRLPCTCWPSPAEVRSLTSVPPERTMNESQIPEQKDPYAFPGPDDPPREWARKEDAYARERDRLVRDHLGKFVVVHQDEVFGPFDTLGEATLEGYRH